ncbi:cell wall metabolism sensor histidine kinase WalK [Amycolatopsis sp. BJA-103]|uniref:sensor histidine kinase n=1 Tax=unclassified Amycolatopsis TaxID=2618356 RepID=UPI000C75A1A7|nr:HAMP domain-containing sensor histidine kinase [Amycolatopsis sp. BJA-103]AUI58304.1 two-component sensor histidine kinase [Amycolatopsis sp. BJA-103]PNE14832.1 two-component sensor histidine kinase [Amycolatopsis sp. BJA-103]
MNAGRLLPRGLRARLLVAFVLVAVLAAAAAAWSSARSASAALVATTQQRLAGTLTGQIAAVAPQLTYPPTQDSLDRLRAALGANTLVTYGDLRSEDGADLGTGSLRAAVRGEKRLVTQRLIAGETPWLLIGTPVMLTAPDGARAPSGIEVYSAHDLTGVEEQIDHLTRSAAITAAMALPLAVLLALLAAGSVLRPVRKLRDTARRLAAGDLDARTPPQGADELADLTVTVNEMAESLQRMQADAKRFAADVSHELRTPLSTLTAVVEVMAATADTMEPDARESAQLAITETHRLVRLVEDLMEVSRFDAGTAQMRWEETDVAAAVRECLRSRGWLEQVELLVPEEISLRLDRRRLDVVVANLVGNALRYGAPPVRVRISVLPDQVRVEVTDHGPGLPEHVLPKVFDRFYKADTARTRTPGSGLGLAIARENARLHGGDLTADNTVDGGARFELRLPRNLEDR